MSSTNEAIKKHNSVDRRAATKYRHRHAKWLKHHRKHKLTQKQKAEVRRKMHAGFFKKIAKLREDLKLPRTAEGSIEHPKAFINAILEWSGTTDSPRDFAADFLAKDPAYTATDTGLCALQFEQWMIENCDDLYAKFVETFADPSEDTFLIIFEGKLTPDDWQKMKTETAAFVSLNTLVVAGTSDPATGEVSDCTILEATPEGEQPKPKRMPSDDPAADTLPADSREKVKESMSVDDPKAASAIKESWINHDGRVLWKDANGTTWTLSGEKWVTTEVSEGETKECWALSMNGDAKGPYRSLKAAKKFAGRNDAHVIVVHPGSTIEKEAKAEFDIEVKRKLAPAAGTDEALEENTLGIPGTPADISEKGTWGITPIAHDAYAITLLDKNTKDSVTVEMDGDPNEVRVLIAQIKSTTKNEDEADEKIHAALTDYVIGESESIRDGFIVEATTKGGLTVETIRFAVSCIEEAVEHEFSDTMSEAVEKHLKGEGDYAESRSGEGEPRTASEAFAVPVGRKGRADLLARLKGSKAAKSLTTDEDATTEAIVVEMDGGMGEQTWMLHRKGATMTLVSPTGDRHRVVHANGKTRAMGEDGGEVEVPGPVKAAIHKRALQMCESVAEASEPTDHSRANPYEPAEPDYQAFAHGFHWHMAKHGPKAHSAAHVKRAAKHEFYAMNRDHKDAIAKGAEAAKKHLADAKSKPTTEAIDEADLYWIVQREGSEKQPWKVISAGIKAPADAITELRTHEGDDSNYFAVVKAPSKVAAKKACEEKKGFVDIFAEAVQTKNADYGYHGTMYHQFRGDSGSEESHLKATHEAGKAYAAMHKHIVKKTGVSHETARKYLDSRMGRHLADQVSQHNPADHKEAAKHHDTALARMHGKKGLKHHVEQHGTYVEEGADAIDESDAPLYGYAHERDMAHHYAAEHSKKHGGSYEVVHAPKLAAKYDKRKAYGYRRPGENLEGKTLATYKDGKHVSGERAPKEESVDHYEVVDLDPVKEGEQELPEVAPPGWSGTVRAMKKHKDIKNPFALAWAMKKRGAKPRVKPEESVTVSAEVGEQIIAALEETGHHADAIHRVAGLVEFTSSGTTGGFRSAGDAPKGKAKISEPAKPKDKKFVAVAEGHPLDAYVDTKHAVKVYGHDHVLRAIGSHLSSDKHKAAADHLHKATQALKSSGAVNHSSLHKHVDKLVKKHGARSMLQATQIHMDTEKADHKEAHPHVIKAIHALHESMPLEESFIDHEGKLFTDEEIGVLWMAKSDDYAIEKDAWLARHFAEAEEVALDEENTAKFVKGGKVKVGGEELHIHHVDNLDHMPNLKKHITRIMHVGSKEGADRSIYTRKDGSHYLVKPTKVGAAKSKEVTVESEDLELIDRTSRAPERSLHVFDVGPATEEQARAVIEKFKERMRVARLDESVTTKNETGGFHGTLRLQGRSKKETEELYAAAHRHLTRDHKLHPKVARNYLDSAYGRHTADQLRGVKHKDALDHVGHAIKATHKNAKKLHRAFAAVHQHTQDGYFEESALADQVLGMLIEAKRADGSKKDTEADDFDLEDVQTYYDMMVVQNMEEDDAIERTKEKFKLTDLQVSPTGKVASKDVAEPIKMKNGQPAAGFGVPPGGPDGDPSKKPISGPGQGAAMKEPATVEGDEPENPVEDPDALPDDEESGLARLKKKATEFDMADGNEDDGEEDPEVASAKRRRGKAEESVRALFGLTEDADREAKIAEAAQRLIAWANQEGLTLEAAMAKVLEGVRNSYPDDYQTAERMRALDADGEEVLNVAKAAILGESDTVSSQPSPALDLLVHERAGVNEAKLNDKDLRDYFVPGKSLVIDNVWWTIKTRDLDTDKATLAKSEYALKDGHKPATMNVKYSDILKNINAGKWGGSTPTKGHIGHKQDKQVRAAFREKNGLRAPPGTAKEKGKAE